MSVEQAVHGTLLLNSSEIMLSVMISRIGGAGWHLEDRTGTQHLHYPQPLPAGYQQQLLYKHMDGSYSAFGEGSEPGNTW